MNFEISIDFIEHQSKIREFHVECYSEFGNGYLLEVKVVSNKELSEGLLKLLAKDTNFKDCIKDKLEFCVKNNINKIEEINLKLKNIAEYSDEDLNDSNFSARDQIIVSFFDKEAYIEYHVYFKKTIEQLLQEIKDSVVYIDDKD